LAHVGPSAHHLIDRQRAGFGVPHLQVELPTGASFVSSVFGSTPKEANCASAQIDLDKRSDARKRNGERIRCRTLCSSFGVDFHYSGSHAPRENNQPMVSRDWAAQHIHECIVGSPYRFCATLNLGLHAISLIVFKNRSSKIGSRKLPARDP
jgi:hypothetical protein